jgi:hypothetical protein
MLTHKAPRLEAAHAAAAAVPAQPTWRMFQKMGCMNQYCKPAPANAIMSPCRKPVISMEPRDRITPSRATLPKIALIE